MTHFRLLTITFISVAVAILGAAPPARAVTIPTVLIGNAGNLSDTTGYGAVAYDYSIATTEVTIGQYTDFLNAVAKTDTYSLYSASMGVNNMDVLFNPNIAGIKRTGTSGNYVYTVIGSSANRPITYVSWGDAARFTNWLSNNQPTGGQNASTTEDGAYFLNGATSTLDLMNASIVRKPTGKWFLPTENEWYKAAYHKKDGLTGNYWDYPTSSDTVPISDNPATNDNPANSANYYNNDSLVNGFNDGYGTTGLSVFSGLVNYLTDVGAYAQATSPYGTLDQAGSVWEWNEAVFEGERGIRGGSWTGDLTPLAATSRAHYDPASQNATQGFRVVGVTVPEPSTVGLLLLGLVTLAATIYRVHCRASTCVATAP